jgi:hypothetical protein
LFLPEDGAFRLGAASQKFVGAPQANVVNKDTKTEPGYFLYFMPTFNF